LLAAVEHLLRTNPVPEVVSLPTTASPSRRAAKDGHAHREEIEANLARHGRYWAEVRHLPVCRTGALVPDHQGILTVRPSSSWEESAR
jgi:hypothetical protein